MRFVHSNTMQHEKYTKDKAQEFKKNKPQQLAILVCIVQV